jgi:hypothetical protein
LSENEDVNKRKKEAKKRKGVNNQNNSSGYFRLLTLFLHHHFLYNSIKKRELWSKQWVVLPISGGLTKTGQAVKTTRKGLQGFNQFVKRTPGITATEWLPTGMKWQQRAGQLFQTNKINQQGLKDLGTGLKTTGVISTTKKELEKKKY